MRSVHHAQVAIPATIATLARFARVARVAIVANRACIMKAPAQSKPEAQTVAPLQTAPPQAGEQPALVVDQRPESALQRQRQLLANDSPQARQLRGQAQLMQSGPRALQMRTLAASLRGEQPVQAQAASSNVLQANGLALDLLEEGGSFTLSYLKGVLAKHGLSSISEVLLNACSYLITQQITDALASYAAVMTPYLAILRQAKTALSALQAIPAPVTTVLAFGIGWCVASFSSRWLKGYFTEPMIHAILTGTGSFIAGLTELITWLDDSINAPASAVYRGVHGILSGIYAYLSGSSSVSSPPSGDTPPDDSGSSPPRAQSQAPAPMIDTKLGFMWAKMEAPKLAKWDGEETERAGMEIDGGFGFNLFGHGMDIDGLQFRVPYGGDWRLNFTSEYTIASDIELAGVFSVGSVVATNISVNREGLQSVAIKIRDITVGDDVIENGTLDMAYARGKKELDFAGSADLSVFGHTVHGAFGLGMGLDGSLKRGALDIKSRERFTLLGGKLAISNPAFGAKFAPGMADISMLGDVELAIYKGIKATGTALRIAYEGGKLSGCIAKLTVDIPVSPNMAVQLELTEGKVDANGFAAEKALIRVSYIAAPPQPVAQSGDGSGSSGGSASSPEVASVKPPAIKPAELDSLLPGFDMSWIKAAGIETLVAEASASKVKLNGDGLAAESTEKRIARFAAQMFGVRAEFDADKGSGSIGGQTPTKELAAGFHIPFPIVPGFNGYIEMNASLAMSAGLKGTATKTPPKRGSKMPWLLGAEANARADGKLSLAIGTALGLGPLASIKAELYGALNPSLLGTASASGMVLFDESTGSISQSAVAKEKPQGSYRLVAKLSAQVSARLRAQALFVFQRTLYEVRLKEWNLGQYVVEGKFVSGADGDLMLDPDTEPSHKFNGKANPDAPEADSAEISSLTFLQRLRDNPATKVSDKLLVYRVLHDMFDPTAGLSVEEQELYLPILCRAVEGDATSVNLEAIMDQIALRKGAVGKSGEALQSHIMAPQEWLDYSTTKGLFGIKERKSVKPIDAEVLAYSQAAPDDYVGRIAIIKKLVPLCEGYSGSRANMVLRLKFGAQRELEILENLKQAG